MARWIRKGAAAAVVAAPLLVVGAQEAVAYCPPWCWLPLNCCCLTPCPVVDSAHAGGLVAVMENVRRTNRLIGVRVPGLDDLGSDLYAEQGPGLDESYKPGVEPVAPEPTPDEDRPPQSCEGAEDDGKYARPVGGPITSPFGMRTHPITKDQRFHKGIDIGAGSGTPVQASRKGKITFAGWQDAANHGKGYGQYIDIDHGGGASTRYAHLSAMSVSVGQCVPKGAQIGAVGSTGGSTGPHLHFETRDFGTPVDPQSKLDGSAAPLVAGASASPGDPASPATASTGAGWRNRTTPVSPETLQARGMVAVVQATRNSLRGPRSYAGLATSFAQASFLRLPEGGLDEAALPRAHAQQAKSGGEPEGINAARGRIDAAAYSRTNLDREQRGQSEERRQDDLRKSALNGYARALGMRAQVAGAADRAAALEERMDDTLTVADEFRLNSEIWAAVMSEFARGAEIGAAHQELAGIRDIREDQQQMRESLPPNPVHGVDAGLRSKLASSVAASDQRSNYETAVLKAAYAHNALTDLRTSQSYLPSLLQDVQAHELRKQHAYLLELDVRRWLGTLYLDGDAAFARLEADLLAADRSTYAQQDRYARTQAVLAPLIPVLTAQTGTTRYGVRRAGSTCYTRTDGGGDAGWGGGGSGESGQNCLPYAIGGGSSAIAQVAGAFAGTGDEYERGIVGQIYTSRESCEWTTPCAADEQLFVLLQYHREADRRRDQWAAMRRGTGVPGDRTMSADLWNDVVDYERDACLMGPVPASAVNVAARPDLFDVNPDCPYRFWRRGAAVGKVVESTNLGGVDASIWLAALRRIEYQQAGYQGRSSVDELASQAQAQRPADGGAGEEERRRSAALDAALAGIAADAGNTRLIDVSSLVR